MVLFCLQVKNGQTLQKELLAPKMPKLEEIFLTVAIATRIGSFENVCAIIPL